MRMICMVDDSVQRSSPFWGEHGVAFVIEMEAGRVLFDTGQSDTVHLTGSVARGVEGHLMGDTASAALRLSPQSPAHAMVCSYYHGSVTKVRAFESPGEYFLHILSSWCLPESVRSARVSPQ